MKWQVLVLIGITFVGAAIRLFNVDESLWLDELHSSWSVSGRLAEVYQRAGDGNQPPLYFWTVWFVIQFLGKSEFTLRLLSLVAGIALIPVCWVIVQRFSRSDAGAFLAAILVCIEPKFIFFSIEFRAYIVVILVGLIQIAVFAHLLLGDIWRNLDAEAGSQAVEKTQTPPKPKRRRNKKKSASKQPKQATSQTTASLKTEKETGEAQRTGQSEENPRVSWNTRLWFCGLTILLFNLHFTSALILLPEIAITAIAFSFRDFRKRYSPLQFFCDGCLIAVGFLPLVITVAGIGAKRDDWAPIANAAWPLRHDFQLIVVGYLIPILLFGGGYLLRLALLHDRKRWLQVENKIMYIAAVFFLCGAGLICTIWLLTHFKIASLFLPRYFAVVLATPFVAAGVMAGAYGKRFARHQLPLDWILAGLLLCIAVGSLFHYDRWVKRCLLEETISMMRHEPWNEVVATLNNQPSTKEKMPVFLISSLIEDYRLFSKFEPTERFVEYCKFPVSGIYSLDRGKYRIIPIPSLFDVRKFKEHLVPDDVLKLIAQENSVLVVCRGENASTDLFNEIAIRLEEQDRNLLVEPYGERGPFGWNAVDFKMLSVFRLSSGPRQKPPR